MDKKIFGAASFFGMTAIVLGAFGAHALKKVLSVDQTKGHIDVSLRRVGDHQRSELLDQLKQEMKSEKILEVFCHEKKTDVKVTYAAIMPQVQKTYLFLHQAFSAVMQGSYDIAQLGLPKQETESLKTLILQRIKPPQVEIIGKFKIISFANNGIELIRETLTKAANVSKNLSLVYGGGGYYNMKITGADFKDAEKVLSDILSIIEPVFKEAKEAQYEFVRSEGKQVS